MDKVKTNTVAVNFNLTFWCLILTITIRRRLLASPLTSVVGLMCFLQSLQVGMQLEKLMGLWQRHQQTFICIITLVSGIFFGMAVVM
jgi:hypothetical protein